MSNRASLKAASRANSETFGSPGSVISSETQMMMANAPSFYASGAQLAWVGNDVVVSFTRPVMGHVLDDGAPKVVAQIQPVVEINLSTMTIKDLSIILSEFVSNYQAQFVEIETDFTRLRAAEKIA